MKRKVISLLLAAAMTAGLLTGCGDSKSGNAGGDNGNATKIVIYAGGSSEFAWVKGSEESEVIDYIEQAYYEATGTLLDFEITFTGKDLGTQMTNAIAGGDQLDVAISHTRGGSGIDDVVVGKRDHRLAAACTGSHPSQQRVNIVVYAFALVGVGISVYVHVAVEGLNFQ